MALQAGASIILALVSALAPQSAVAADVVRESLRQPMKFGDLTYPPEALAAAALPRPAFAVDDAPASLATKSALTPPTCGLLGARGTPLSAFCPQLPIKSADC